MKKFAILAFTLIILLHSCMPEDDPVKPYDRGDKLISQVVVGLDYRWTHFFNLNDNRIVKTSLMTDFDLAFNCSDTSNIIMLNGATYMSVVRKGAVAFEDVKSYDSTDFWYGENPYGYENIDSSAIGKWYDDSQGEIVSLNHVYIINRGSNWIGKPLGYKKMMILSADAQGYEIKVADLDGKNERNIKIQRNPNLNYIALSLTKDEIVEFEPPTIEWDIVFTKYTYIFYEPDYIPYAVAGVLLNPKFTSVALDTVNAYEDITSNHIESYTFSNLLDGIGWDWKRVNIETGVYTIYPWKNYILRDRKGFYYKLHFIDYYDDEGTRGAPKFEFQKL
jgi:hypothetical protein